MVAIMKKLRNQALVPGTILASAVIVVIAILFVYPKASRDKITPQPEETANGVILSDKNISVPEGWHLHRLSNSYFLLTRQEKLPEIGGTELYAYGEQIGISVIPIDTTPEEWVAQKMHIDLDDVLVKKATWGMADGYKLLRVEHETPADPQLSEYLFTENVIYIFSLYPIPNANTAIFEEMVSEFARRVTES